MNYYEHHLGDWAAATGHLSWDEDMAYTRLLRAYYHAERPIPQGQQYRLAKASSATQRSAVDSVINEFFTLEDDGCFHQKRADAEIARYMDKQRKAKASAEARWSHNGRNANAMRTHSERNAEAMLTKHQAPDTRHQTPIAQANACAERSPAAEVCIALKAAGIGRVAPGNLRLTNLLEAGATVEEFVSFAPKALEQAPARAFEYVLGAVEGERKRAEAMAGKLHQGRMPNKQEALERRNRAIAEEFIKKLEKDEHAQ